MQTIDTLIADFQNLKNNKIVFEFAQNEAREKVAAEIRAQFGGETTAKAVALLEARYANIAARVAEYTDIGILGCVAVKHNLLPANC
jgi:hypothetical protein